MTIKKNATPIEVEEFLNRVSKNLYQFKNYYSIYITPRGQIIDCGYPECLGHNDISEYIYNNLEKTDEKVFNSRLRGLETTFKQVPYYMEDFFDLLKIYYEDKQLYWIIDKQLLGTEDRICQDMGFVKISINNNLKIAHIVTPNSIFEKSVTAHQKETIEKLSEHFNIDLIPILKSSLKENARIASQIQQCLNKLNIHNK